LDKKECFAACEHDAVYYAGNREVPTGERQKKKTTHARTGINQPISEQGG